MRTLRELFSCRAAMRMYLCAWLIILFDSTTLARDGGLKEHHLKAAFFHRFANYLKWQDHDRPHHPLLLCVMGDAEVAETLTQILRRESRAVVKLIGSTEDGRSCDLLYLGRHMQQEPNETLELLAGSGTVTVSDIPSFAERGGMIELVIDHPHLRFIINKQAADKQGVSISSQLLALAQRTIR